MEVCGAENQRRRRRTEGSGTIQKSCSGRARDFSQWEPPAAMFTEGRVRVELRPKREPQRLVLAGGMHIGRLLLIESLV